MVVGVRIELKDIRYNLNKVLGELKGLRSHHIALTKGIEQDIKDIEGLYKVATNLLDARKKGD